MWPPRSEYLLLALREEAWQTPDNVARARESPAAVSMRRWGTGLRLEAWVTGGESWQVCRAVQVVCLVDIFSKKKEARLSHQGKPLITCVSRDKF